MTKLNYKQIMYIQKIATKKLLMYMDEHIEKKDVLEATEFYYPDCDDYKKTIAFNVWVSLDYRTTEGKSLIEHLLDEKPQSLTTLEKEILEEKNKSHISLFEVVDIDGDYIHVEDLLCREHHVVLEPKLCKLINTSDLLFGRVAKLIKFEKFIGDLNSLPCNIKEMFLKAIFINFNLIRKEEPNLDIQGYLKKYSINVYKIYTKCMQKIIAQVEKLDKNFNIHNQLNLQLESFKKYLTNNFSNQTVQKHMSCIMYLSIYYLAKEELTLNDLDEVILENIFKTAISNNILFNNSELPIYINSFKKYFEFMRKKEDCTCEKIYSEMLKINKKDFSFLDNYNKIELPTELPMEKNKDIIYAFKNNLNRKSRDFLRDYEKYLSYIQTNNVEVTATKKYIKRNELLEINKILTNKMDVSCLKTPNQIDMPLLHLFYAFSISYNILSIKNGKISASTNLNSFLTLNDEEKLSFFVHYICNIISWRKLDPNLYINIDDIIRHEIFSFFSILNLNTIYTTNKLFSHITYELFTNTIANLFDAMGLINIVNSSELKFYVTSLGKKVFEALKKYIRQNSSDKILFIDEYQKDN